MSDRRTEAEINRLYETYTIPQAVKQILHLREIIRSYNPDDAIFDDEKGLRPISLHDVN